MASTISAFGDKVVDQIKALEEKLAELEKKIRETEKRLPAHSVKPPIMTALFELEDEYETVFEQLKALKKNQN
jgi:hypothetical protein